MPPSAEQATSSTAGPSDQSSLPANPDVPMATEYDDDEDEYESLESANKRKRKRMRKRMRS